LRLILMMIACRKPRATALPLSARSSDAEAQILESIDASWPGIGPMRRVSGWMRYQVLGLPWRPRLLPALPIRKLSDRDGTSRPGLGWYERRTPAVARRSSVSITKDGDRYLRSLFTTDALAVIRYAKIHGTKHRPWLTGLLARRPKVAAIALANNPATMAERLPIGGLQGECHSLLVGPDQVGRRRAGGRELVRAEP
jgi:hypothetical protein